MRMMAAPLAGTVFEVRDSICDRVLAVESEGPGLVIAGGEATMVLPLQPGLGGRAQHLALLLAERIAGRANVQIMVAGSDGIDGNSKAAGAVVDGTTWRSLVQADLDPSGALERCDSARVLAAIGAQIVTGPTGVNHADLVVVQIS